MSKGGLTHHFQLLRPCEFPPPLPGAVSVSFLPEAERTRDRRNTEGRYQPPQTPPHPVPPPGQARVSLPTQLPGNSSAAPACPALSSSRLQRAFATAAFNPLLALAHSSISCGVTRLKTRDRQGQRSPKSPQRGSKEQQNQGSRGKPGQRLCPTSCRHPPCFGQPSHSPAQPQSPSPCLI